MELHGRGFIKRMSGVISAPLLNALTRPVHLFGKQYRWVIQVEGGPLSLRRIPDLTLADLGFRADLTASL